jgi:hypothetical protein
MRFSTEFTKQPDLREFPIAHDRIGRHLQYFRSLLNRETAKEPQLDNLGFSRIDGIQGAEGIIDGDDVSALITVYCRRCFKRHEVNIATSLLVSPGPGMVYEHAPHQLSGNSQEMGAILPANAGRLDQFLVSFMNYGGSLKRVAGTFPAHVGAR